MKYPHINFLFRCLNFIFRKLPLDEKLYYYGILLKKDLYYEPFKNVNDKYTFTEANIRDVQSISENPESLSFDVYRDRLAKGHICYCVKKQFEIMCYVWFSFRESGLFFGSINEIDFFSLKVNQAYSYNLYTYKKFRHKGIASLLHKYCNQKLIEKGITERLSVIGPSFVASMKIALKNGFEPQKIVYVYGIKNFRKVFLGTEKDLATLRIWKIWFKKNYMINSSTR